MRWDTLASIEPNPEDLVEPGERMLLFRAGNRGCACLLSQVREIVPMRPVTRLPGAAAWVRGLLNHRGALVPVADLTGWLGEAVPVHDEGRRVLVVEGDGRGFGLVVDQVREVRALPADAEPGLLRLDLDALGRELLASRAGH